MRITLSNFYLFQISIYQTVAVEDMMSVNSIYDRTDNKDLNVKAIQLKNLIDDIWTFLKDHLSLLNTHGAEFISDNHWEKFVPVSVRPILLSLSDEQLVNLPLGLTNFEDQRKPNEEDTNEKV